MLLVTVSSNYAIFTYTYYNNILAILIQIVAIRLSLLRVVLRM